MHKPGDKVDVETKDGVFTGIIMPNENADILFIKLISGYNVGIEKKKIKQIDVIEAFKENVKEKKAEIKDNKNLPTISILHTGGTIASKVDYRTGGVISKFSPEDLLNMFPEIHEIANIKSRQIFQMFSEDMEPAHWALIAKAVAEEVEKGVDGIIITHGTDTLMYSSAALSFMVQNLPIPVIYVAAQRSSDRASSDAGENVIAACKFIAQTDYAGIGVCMHKNEDDGICLIHSGTKVKKMHTSRRDTFRSVNVKPIAQIEVKSGKITYLRPIYDKKEKKKVMLNNKFESKVAIVKIRPGFDYHELEFYEKNGYKGLVLEGTGLGNAPVNVLDEHTKHHADLLKTIKRMAEKMVIVMTSQATYGMIDMNVYSSGRDLLEAGVISGQDMMPEVAYAKLMWGLGHHKQLNEAKKEMQTNLVGEIAERIEKNTFLI